MDQSFDLSFKISSKIKTEQTKEFFLGKNLKTNSCVLIKKETNYLFSGLEDEIKIYDYLMKDPEYSDHIPKMHYAGFYEDGQVLVLDQLGESLQELFELCGRSFSLKTVLMLAEQMIDRIQFVHKNKILHKDIKPSNFLIGLGEKKHRIFLIDYGISDFYILPNGKHIPWTEKTKFIGTPMFASVNAHLKNEVSRKDDLESLGNCLLYFLRGNLPWEEISEEDCQIGKLVAIRCNMWNNAITGDIYKNIPKEFQTYMTYCRKLCFSEEPDYKYMKSIFRDLMKKEGFVYDYDYDWIIIKEKC